ncbi:hypothetical protein CRG98_002355 [Punica granatum]|uniref:Uncharacterized protein n=1 Tax=Punica granatum TaxID=22663 RepID=A0A2I0L963_PUNGR|nr:hypothetical protein CRG98_002355 [Punica granatum]
MSRSRWVDFFGDIGLIPFRHPETLTSRNWATYADVAENARSSSVGCSGKYRRCMKLASRWRRTSQICRNLAGAVDVESAHWIRKGPLGFHRATHKNRADVNSRQKCLHSEKLCSGGGMTGARHSINERSSEM